MSDIFLKEIQESFLAEAVELLQKTEDCFLALEKPGDHTHTLAELKRMAHNFKGSGQAVGFDSISKFAHQVENLLIALSEGTAPISGIAVQLLLDCCDRLKSDVEVLRVDSAAVLNHTALFERITCLLSGSSKEDSTFSESALLQKIDAVSPQLELADEPSELSTRADPFETPKNLPSKPSGELSQAREESIRVPMKRIDELLDAFGEQVIFLSALDHYKDDLLKHRDEIARTVFNLKKLAFDIQQSTLKLRMVNLKSLFSKLERAVRDASKVTAKEVACTLLGADQELDKIIVDQLSDPLTHMVRNAVDHGLESPEDRIALGKPSQGSVQISARREGGAFVIEVRDDGKGIEPAEIRAKAEAKGLIRRGLQLSDSEAFDLLFINGFSTKETASELSGRGVGLNVVKEMISSLKGTCEIQSQKGVGTVFKMTLPMSLSLFNGILLQIGRERYIVPSSQVSEIVDSGNVSITQLGNGKMVTQLRESVLELIDLKLTLKLSHPSQTGNRSMILVPCASMGKVGFLVDKVFGIQRIVQKTLSQEATICPGAVGVTILGDGNPALILDLKHLSEPSKFNGAPRLKCKGMAS